MNCQLATQLMERIAALSNLIMHRPTSYEWAMWMKEREELRAEMAKLC